MCNLIIIRHFKTSHNKINYENCYKEAGPYIEFINKYIKDHDINEIYIYTSAQDRTFITGLVICAELQLHKSNNIFISNPIINKNIDRDPFKKHKKSIAKYFSTNVKKYCNNDNSNKLIIYVTHSSVYYTIFKSIVDTLKNKDSINISSRRIHYNSLSYISKNDKKIKYEFNLEMINKK